MKSLFTLAPLCLFAAFSPSLEAATSIFSENFSTTTIAPNANPYVGGWFGSPAGFQTWNGSSEASITTGAIPADKMLTLAPTSGIRSAGIVLSPDLFSESGAGSYTLSFDVTAYGGDSNDSGVVRIWSGSDYVMGGAGNALQLDTLNGELKALGSATVNLLGSASVIETDLGTRKSITFTYDGSSAVALFFGAETGGWPFPTVSYDNISITQNVPALIPEPSVSALAAGLLGMMSLIRRRTARISR